MRVSNLFMAVLLLMTTVVFANHPVAPDIEAQTDQLVEEYLKLDMFSGNVLVAHKGQAIYQKSYGHADKEYKVPINSDTRFNIASIGKRFTAVLILQLAEKGKLNLNDKLGDFVDGFADERAANATIRQLLRHEAGFGDFIAHSKFKVNPRKYAALEDMLGLVKSERLAFEPGKAQLYSNSGFVLLGAVIEKVTGQSYEQVLAQRILHPAKMNNTVYSNVLEAENRAIGYKQLLSGDFEAVTLDEAPPSPAGGIYTTTNDLLNFDRSLAYSNSLLSDASKAMLYSNFEKKSAADWQKIASDDSAIAAIAGGAYGVSTTLYQALGQDYTVIVLSNYGDYVAENLSENLLSILQGDSYDSPQLPAYRYAYYQIHGKGVKNFIKNYASIMEDGGYKADNHWVLNSLGYRLLGERYNDFAIKVLKANCELFPNEANTFDSLGEAYMIANNKKQAKANYEKSLALNPANTNAEMMLAKLEEM